MVEETKTEKISPEQLMVSTLAAADATVKLLIAKGVFTDEEFKAQLSTERANYIAVPKPASLKMAACFHHSQLATRRDEILFFAAKKVACC